MQIKKLSIWAKNNPKLARIIIALSHILVVLNSICLGILIFFYDWGESKWLFSILINIFFLAYFLYPSKKGKKTILQYSYFRQKSLDFTLVITYSFVLALGVNNFLSSPNMDINLPRQGVDVKAEFIVNKTYPKKEKVTKRNLRKELKLKIKRSKREIKREFRALKKEFKQNNSSSKDKGLKIGLSLLVLLAALVLAYLIAALACNLSCSGQESLAGVVAIGGALVIIGLSILAFKEIWKKKGVTSGNGD